MSSIKITLPVGVVPTNGQMVSFVAPCDCSAVTDLLIDDVTYTIVDAMANSVVGSDKTNVWCSGAVLSAVLDVDNHRAFLLNGVVNLTNLFAAGPAVLSSNQYGDTLPAPGTPGRFFLKKIQ